MLLENRRVWTSFATELANRGYAVLAFDLRGHGSTKAARDWEKSPEDVVKAWEYLKSRPEVDRTRTAILGASIGANLALVASAATSDVSTAIALSPGPGAYTEQTTAAMNAFAQRSALVVVSQRDSPPAEFVEQLSKSAPATVTFKTFEGSSHGRRMLASEHDLPPLIFDWLETQLRH